MTSSACPPPLPTLGKSGNHFWAEFLQQILRSYCVSRTGQRGVRPGHKTKDLRILHRGEGLRSLNSVQFRHSVVSNSATPWTAACQASLSITKFMSIESVMPSNHLILCHPLLLLPSIFPSIRVFSNESVLHIR